MNKNLITLDNADLPSDIRSFITGNVYDSSCSPEAKVYHIPDQKLFIKRSAKDSLKKEALMDNYYHSLGLGAEVVCYLSDKEDWLVTTEVLGDDLTSEKYISRPEWLCDTLATTLRMLHSIDFSGCPITQRNKEYLKTVNEGYAINRFDRSYYCADISKDDAFAIVKNGAHTLDNNVLLHGDYCLPNLIFKQDRLSGFIDLGNGGVGDRHIDVFWGIWTLEFNLKTDIYRSRFIDAYGNDLIDPEKLRFIGACECFG